MSRFYVEGDIVRFKETGLCTVEMEVYGGDVYKNLTPKRLFPMSGGNKYISLLDEEMKEKAIIRDLDTLMPESKKVIEDALCEYYFMPKIIRINMCDVKFGLLNFDVDTDKGNVKFSVKNRHYDIKKLENERILIRDGNDNRYEIEDYSKLDKKSARMLYQYI